MDEYENFFYIVHPNAGFRNLCKELWWSIQQEFNLPQRQLLEVLRRLIRIHVNSIT